MSDILIIYHANCMDGAGSFWAAKQKYPDAEGFAAKHGAPPPDVTNKDVYILDFSYPRDTLIRMAKEASFLQVCDHHISAQKDLEGLDFCIFDMNRSGAGLSWDYFFPDKKRPWLIDYVEDRDLWRFKLPGSRAVNAFVNSFDFTLENYERIANTPLEAARGAGEAILRQMQKMVELSIGRVKFVDLLTPDKKDVRQADIPLVYNSVGPILTSEIGEALYTKYENAPFVIVLSDDTDGKWLYSLRARADNDFDVSALAREYGGGGHRKASGFKYSSLLYNI